MPHFLYIVECADKTLYTGTTNNINARILLHNTGKGARYTRGRGPVRLRYSERFTTLRRAMQREREIKRLDKVKKLALISH